MRPGAPPDETRKAELIREITAAFNGVSRGSGVTIHETEVIDDYGSPAERSRARALDREKRWQDVPDKVLETHFGFCFFDPQGLRYYLPAYLVWYLKYINLGGFESMTSHSLLYTLEEKDEARQREYFGSFTAVESLAIAHFLEFEAERAESENLARDPVWRQMTASDDYPREILDAYAAGLLKRQNNHARHALDRYWGRFLASAIGR